jgi:RNA polymerase sigma-70 factor, ECF subfamily
MAQPGSSPVSVIPAKLVHELFELASAASYGIEEAVFGAILGVICSKHLPEHPLSSPKVEIFLRSLRLEELALARGCAAGHDGAWDIFMNRFREKLYDAGRVITKEDAAGRELADSIYGELYGVSQRDGARRSKLASYTGRGSLEGWLRTVLAQEWVNRYRKGKRLVSLEEEEEQGAQFAAAPVSEATPIHATVLKATDSALADLEPEDRFILAAYFLDQRTLAEIGRTLGVHESTISRKVERAASALRKNIFSVLMRSGLSRRQAEEAMQVDVRDLTVDVRSRLATKAPESLSRAGLQEGSKESF